MYQSKVNIKSKKNILKKNLWKAILAFLILFIASCSKMDMSDSKAQTEAIDVENERLKSLHDAGIEEEKIDISYSDDGFMPLNIKYPRLTSDDATIQKALDIVNEDLKTSAERFKKENVELEVTEEEKAGRDEYGFSLDNTDVTLTNFSDKYFSLIDFSYVDYMGAHPTYFIGGYIFDRKSGKELKIFDLIKDKEELRDYLKKWVKENDEDGAFFDDFAEDSINNYVDGNIDLECYVENDEIYVIFQIYDIAPYAVGAIHVNIPKELLR